MLASDADLRMRMGQAARARAMQSFSSEAMLKAYLEAIDEVVNV